MTVAILYKSQWMIQDFPEANLLFGNIFAESCMKMKDWWCLFGRIFAKFSIGANGKICKISPKQAPPKLDREVAPPALLLDLPMRRDLCDILVFHDRLYCKIWQI